MNDKRLRMGLVLLVGILVCALAGSAYAHFQMLIPSTCIVAAAGDREVHLDIIFAHPMEGSTMAMARPVRFGVMVQGKRQDLLATLKPKQVKGHAAFETSYTIRRPGDHVFYLEPAPYWEPAEGCMIVHYTKVVVNVLGLEAGWDEEVGFPVEIVPLVRPYGLWTGNLFQGIVKKAGQPVPFAEIEVEYYNQKGEVKVPSGPFVTQVIKADANGVFSYALPRAGWWGFAALLEGDKPMKNPQGKDVPVEMGALMWVEAVDMK